MLPVPIEGIAVAWTHTHTQAHTHARTPMLLLTMMAPVLLDIKGSDTGTRTLPAIVKASGVNAANLLHWTLCFSSFYWLSRKVIEGQDTGLNAGSPLHCAQLNT